MEEVKVTHRHKVFLGLMFVLFNQPSRNILDHCSLSHLTSLVLLKQGNKGNTLKKLNHLFGKAKIQ